MGVVLIPGFMLDADLWRGYRVTTGDVERPLADVAPEEIVNAMADVAARHRCADEEQLFRATLEVFGQRRLTGTTTTRLEACLRLAEGDARLIRGADGSWSSVS